MSVSADEEGSLLAYHRRRSFFFFFFRRPVAKINRSIYLLSDEREVYKYVSSLYSSERPFVSITSRERRSRCVLRTSAYIYRETRDKPLTPGKMFVRLSVLCIRLLNIKYTRRHSYTAWGTEKYTYDTIPRSREWLEVRKKQDSSFLRVKNNCSINGRQ